MIAKSLILQGVTVGATLQFVPPGINFGNPGDTYVGTTANLTFP